jgi:L-lactate dehydrogenase complex protein LldG
MNEESQRISQGSVLDDIRRALGRELSTPPATLPRFSDADADSEVNGALAQAAVVDRFVDEATTLGCDVRRVATSAQVAACVSEICVEVDASEIVLSGAPLLVQLGIKGSQVPAGQPKDEVVAQLATRHAGVTAVTYAIAETGTLLLTSDEDLALLSSLLPPVHIAILRQGQIKRSLATVLTALNSEYMGREVPCRSATFISGPSRTSDVELTLSIGVHGPKQLFIVLVGE